VPVLYEMDQFAKLNPAEQEYKLLMTKLVRERNRVADALTDASWHIDQTLGLLGA
jgi:hypothetical protein